MAPEPPSVTALVSGSAQQRLHVQEKFLFQVLLHKVRDVKVRDRGWGEHCSWGNSYILLINGLQREWEGEGEKRMEKYHISLELQSSFLSVFKSLIFMTWGKIISHNSFINLNESIIYFSSFAILLN